MANSLHSPFGNVVVTSGSGARPLELAREVGRVSAEASQLLAAKEARSRRAHAIERALPIAAPLYRRALVEGMRAPVILLVALADPVGQRLTEVRFLPSVKRWSAVSIPDLRMVIFAAESAPTTELAGDVLPIEVVNALDQSRPIGRTLLLCAAYGGTTAAPIAVALEGGEGELLDEPFSELNR